MTLPVTVVAKANKVFRVVAPAVRQVFDVVYLDTVQPLAVAIVANVTVPG